MFQHETNPDSPIPPKGRHGHIDTRAGQLRGAHDQWRATIGRASAAKAGRRLSAVVGRAHRLQADAARLCGGASAPWCADSGDQGLVSGHYPQSHAQILRDSGQRRGSTQGREGPDSIVIDLPTFPARVGRVADQHAQGHV